MKLEVTGFRVLIRKDELQKEYGEEIKRSDGSRVRLQISHGEDTKRREAAQATGTVVSIGPTAWMQFQEYDQESGKWIPGKPWAKVGDHVVFTIYGGRDIPKELGDEFRGQILVNDEDVLCRIKE